MSPQTFRTPRRRLTRQRSGYHVSGEKTGSEAILVNAQRFVVSSNSLEMKFINKGCECQPQFGLSSGIVAAGGYIKSENNIDIEIVLRTTGFDTNKIIHERRHNVETHANNWMAFGVHDFIDNIAKYKNVNIETILILQTDAQQIGNIQFFGLNCGAVNNYPNPETKQYFDTKTEIYIPGIYYFKEDAPFNIEPTEINGKIESRSQGEQLVLKACNRCSRYLIIDISDERNTLSFSNHCVSRAPCQHNAFSRYRLQNQIKLDQQLIDSGKIIRDGDDNFVVTHYGFQLECRSCKKFKVNVPLNPMRNETQHREDSLRRRAFEQLVMHLLEKKWVFFEHRLQYGNEFDVYIWKKFDKHCFGCGKRINELDEMNLDHTLPLNYLWPLDDTATCLCKTCNSQKNNKFPYEFEKYQSKEKLRQLAKITKIPYEVLSDKKRRINQNAVDELKGKIVWFFDEFLMNSDFQKIRQGKKAADLIVASLQKVFNASGVGWNLIEEYVKTTSRNPISVSLDSVRDETNTMREPEIDV